MRRRSFQFSIRSLLILVTVFAGSFGLRKFVPPVCTLVIVAIFAGAGCLIYYCFEDVLDLKVFTHRWANRKQVKSDEVDVTAANKLKKKWWKRRKPNRHRQGRPGQDYTFPSRFEE